MIKVLKSGYSKEFVQVCSKCGTSFTYLSCDLSIKSDKNGKQSGSCVTCPICGDGLSPTFVEYKEEKK